MAMQPAPDPVPVESALPLHLCQLLEEEYVATQRVPVDPLDWDITAEQLKGSVILDAQPAGRGDHVVNRLHRPFRRMAPRMAAHERAAARDPADQSVLEQDLEGQPP